MSAITVVARLPATIERADELDGHVRLFAIARTGAPRPTYIPLGCAPSCPKH